MNQPEQTPETISSPPAHISPTLPARRAIKPLWLLGAAVGLGLVAAIVWAVFFRGPPVPPGPPLPLDPRLEYTGPFRNVAPSVKFVSDQSCAECHAEIAQAFSEHPMGRSMAPTSTAPLPSLDAKHHLPFDALGSRFSVQRDGDRIQHRRVQLAPDGKIAAEQTWDVHYAIGSGRRGFSFLTEFDGCLFQTPISWYSQKNIWDLSPGFRSALLTGRPVLPECLFCHANRANPIEGSPNRYAQPMFDGHAIGCQRCHGPGELHVAERHRKRSPGAIDHTIVNPRHLEPLVRDGVCEQCHLVGEDMIARSGRDVYDFRPGLRPEQFWSVLARAAKPGETPKAVSHVEQMHKSRCYERGSGASKIGCISCHDPHRTVPAGDRVGYYRKRCLTCHEQKGCTETAELRQVKKDSCVDCHMQPYGAQDIPHTASTDHRILRTGKAAPPSDPRAGAPLGLPLVSLYRDLPGVDPAEDERGRSIALVKLALGVETFPPNLLRMVLPSLDAAIKRDPADLSAAEARGYALGVQSRHADALAVFQEILVKSPNRERTLIGAAAMASALKQQGPALDYVRRAVAVNPASPDYRRNLAQILVKEEAWAEAQTECQVWIRLDPFSAEARATRVTCLLATGNKAEARAEFARLEALAPPNLGDLRIRFEKKLQ